jgi:hypothetical protein
MANDDSPESTKARVLRACLIVGILLILILAAVPTGLIPELPQRHEARAHALIEILSLSATSYELDYGSYPPGCGDGSSGLLACLQKSGPKKHPCFEVFPDMVDGRGNILSHVREGKIIFYRCPGVHNARSFDLWCEDAKGRPEGINNWEK